MRGHASGRRLVEAVTEHDPLFSDEDTEELLGLVESEDELCPGCGQLRHESFDPASEGEWDVTALRCHACAARDRANGDFGPDSSGGLFFSVKRDGPRTG